MAYLDTVRTASEVVNDLTVPGSTNVDADAAARADTANVRHVSFIQYAAALTNYESRDDVESLAHRRAREASTTFAGTDFVRAEGYDPFA